MDFSKNISSNSSSEVSSQNNLSISSSGNSEFDNINSVALKSLKDRTNSESPKLDISSCDKLDPKALDNLKYAKNLTYLNVPNLTNLHFPAGF
jgi:hypothetical protein